jgi:NAD+ synthase
MMKVKCFESCWCSVELTPGGRFELPISCENRLSVKLFQACAFPDWATPAMLNLKDTRFIIISTFPNTMELLEGTIDVLNVFTKEFVGDRDVIVGISGGVDSTLVSFILKKNIKREKIHLYSLPYGEENKDVKRVSDFLGLPYEKVDMSDALRFFIDFTKDRKIIGNIKARLRMVFLYAMANMHKGLVAGTSNKSELLTGYFTKYGDGGSDFQPIGDLYKTQVYELAKRFNFPDWLLKKKPSADLWDGQTDEAELGISYEKLDKILECIEYLKVPEKCTVDGCALKEVKRIYSLVQENAHKRVNFYIPKIGFRSIGSDWME